MPAGAARRGLAAHLPGDDSAAKVCFASTLAIAGTVQGMRAELPHLTHVVSFDGEEPNDTSYAHLIASASPGDAPVVVPSPDDQAAFIYTSGTTGKPKGVKLQHKALAYEVRALRAAWSIGPGERTVSNLPWAHVGGFCELVVGVQFGGCAALPSAYDKLGEAIRETRPTIMGGVPRVWNALYALIHRGSPRSRLRSSGRSEPPSPPRRRSARVSHSGSASASPEPSRAA